MNDFTKEELKIIIEKDIKATEEFSEFMKIEINPMLSIAGKNHFENLRFFNLGYNYAMKKINQLLENKK